MRTRQEGNPSPWNLRFCCANYNSIRAQQTNTPKRKKKKRGLPYQHSEVFGVTRIDDKFHPRIAQAFTEIIRVYTSSNRQIFRVYRIIVNAINYMFMLYL